MKRVLKDLCIVLIGAIIIGGGYLLCKIYCEKISGNDIIGIDIIHDKLEALGYSEDEINDIKKQFDDETIRNKLFSKKYDSLLEYKESKIFNIDHLDRYETYDNNTKYEKKDIVTYVEIGLDQEFYTNITEVTNYDDILVLVNKYYKLPNNYEANDLVSLGSYASYNGAKLKSLAFEAYKTMYDAAKKEGLSLRIVSAYRTESTQEYLFNRSTKNNGIEHALIYSAKPGHSEHQTGFAVDVNSVEESFKNTKEYTWLINNSYKYGFIERYSEGKEYITGYGYEPWHYRYVGVDVATIIHNQKITFEEYKVLY